MKIGIDCRNIFIPPNVSGAGIGQYIYFFIKSLLAYDAKNTYILFVGEPFCDKEIEENPRVNIRILPFYRWKKYFPLIYSHVFVPIFFMMQGLDVLHGPANILPFFYSGKTVLTIHDLAIYCHPEWFPDKQSFSTRVIVPRSIRRAHKIIAVSEFTKLELQKIFSVPEKKIDVLHHGVIKQAREIDMEKNKKFETRWKKKGQYILFVGTIEPRKNIVSLVRGFEQWGLKEENKQYFLVIAGAKGWKYEPIMKEAKQSRVYERIIFTGFISQEEKWSIIRHCSCFVFPSLYEGFGLPILEAMSIGVPVISTKSSSLQEVGGDAVLYIENPSSIAISNALDEVFGGSEELRKSLSEKGRERAKKFTWDQCAQKILSVYKSLDK